MRRHRLIILPLLLATLVLAACGDDSSSPDGETAATPTATETPTETPAATSGESRVKVTGKAGEKPEIVVPEGGTPPTALVIKDVKKGTGPKAKAGDTVSVQYVGVLHKDGEQFDASWDRGAEPFEFQLGQGMVIPGWDQGIEGMQAGGRRVLTIPPDLAYGETGQGPIGPNETLVFAVDLEEIK